VTRRKRYPYSQLPEGQFVRVWTDSVRPEYYYGRIRYHLRNDKGRPVGITAVETLDARGLGDWYQRPRGWYREMGTEFIEPLGHLAEEPTVGSFICGHPTGTAERPRYCTVTTVEGADRCAMHADTERPFPDIDDHSPYAESIVFTDGRKAKTRVYMGRAVRERIEGMTYTDNGEERTYGSVTQDPATSVIIGKTTTAPDVKAHHAATWTPITAEEAEEIKRAVAAREKAMWDVVDSIGIPKRPSAAAVSMAEAIERHLRNSEYGWIAIRIHDGSTDGQAYDNADDAKAAQSDPSACTYFPINPLSTVPWTVAECAEHLQFEADRIAGHPAHGTPGDLRKE